MDELVGGWAARAVPLAAAGFAHGHSLCPAPQTVASWLRAAAVGRGFSGYYYFISAVGRKSKLVAARLFLLLLQKLPGNGRLLLALDDTPTKRYGPKVQGAGIHHNPTPGPADAKYLYGHTWVTLSWIVRHPLWGTIGLPLLAALYVRQKDIAAIPSNLHWQFQNQVAAGRGTGRLGRKQRVFRGKTAVGGRRRGICQAGLSQATAETRRGGRQPPAEGRPPEHLAAKAQKRTTPRPRKTEKVRHKANQSGQAQEPKAAGKPSSASSTANRSSKSTRAFWPPTARPTARSAW